MSAHADASIYDPVSKLFYVGNGGRQAKQDFCLISIVDTTTGNKVGDIRVEGADRVEAMALERSGPRMFVNLYSKWRGINRFPALTEAFDLLADRPEVKRRGFQVPPLTGVRAWIGRETKLANPTLEAEVAATEAADKTEAAVNTAVEKTEEVVKDAAAKVEKKTAK